MDDALRVRGDEDVEQLIDGAHHVLFDRRPPSEGGGPRGSRPRAAPSPGTAEPSSDDVVVDDANGALVPDRVGDVAFAQKAHLDLVFNDELGVEFCRRDRLPIAVRRCVDRTRPPTPRSPSSRRFFAKDAPRCEPALASEASRPIASPHRSRSRRIHARAPFPGRHRCQVVADPT